MMFALFTAHDRTLDEGRAVWRIAEEVGFDAIGVVDSPLLMREALVSLAALAIDTTRVQIFSSVMNTRTRHPTVTAGAYLGLRDLAGDRAFLAFGAGDSSTHAIGLGAARLADMAEYVTAVRDLLRGETASFQGRSFKGAWHGYEPFEPRLFLSAHGPKALATAGRVADGVICGFGLLPETVERAERIIAESAESVGRDPESIEIWHVAHYCPADTLEDGFLYSGGSGSWLLARGSLEGKLIPEHLHQPIRDVADTWRLDTHGRANPRTVEVAKRTGCLEYLVARGGGLVGPVDTPAVLRELGDRGVRNILFVALGADKQAIVRGLGKAIEQARSPARRGPPC
jgi:5,10-methylenetetrahydromethanopterin reductase